ncbi:MAG: peptidoglycan editing factor PgeF [Campylobacteraceae bacterium]
MKEILLHKGVKIILSDRFGGVSKAPYQNLNLGLHVNDNVLHVKKNREIFANYFSTTTDNLVFMDQIHSDKIQIATSNKLQSCDAIIKKDKNLVLCVMVADCAPIVLYDAKKEIASVIHAGRAGAFLDIVSKTYHKMRDEFGSHAKDIYAYVGPFIKSCCYEINGTVLDEPKEKFAFALTTRNDKYFLDLEQIILTQLANCNILHVKTENICTCCDTNYFSYRREGVCGRFAVGAKLL